MISIAVGRRKRGKSTLTLFLARRKARRIIFDPRAQFASGDVIVESIEDMNLAIAANQFTELVIQPRGDVSEHFAACCLAIQGQLEINPRESFSFLVDEARFIDTRNVAFNWILRCVDHVHVLLTCHRPTDVHVDVRGIADHWLLFHCTQEHDLKTIEERCGRAVAKAVRALAAYQWIHWDDGSGEWTKYLDPALWYVPMTPIATTASVPALDMPFSGTPFDRPRLF